MSLLHRVFLPSLAVLGLGFLIACGGGTNNSTPPPSGSFSNTNFNGTYTFSISGTDANNPNSQTGMGPLTIAGTITACGCSGGQISAGTVDFADASGTTGPLAINTSGSSYKVNPNGIGTLNLNLPLNPNTQFEFAFVLTDAAHGLISEYDQNGTGSGTIDLQPNSVTLATTPYVFSVSGADEAGNALAVAGAFTLNSSGVITTGIADFNDGGSNVATAQPLSGTVTVGAGTANGTATLNFASVSLHFDVYAIDATHLKFIATDSPTELLIGDVFSQGTAAIPTGTLALSMAGSNSSGANVFAIGGIVNSDGSSQLTSGAEDINVNGVVDGNTGTSTTYTPYPFTGTFVASPSGSGRFQVSLSGFQGGANFAAYPSTAGVLLLEVEPSGSLLPGTTSGTAILQSSPAGLVASQGYAMNLTGPSTSAELDQIAQFNTTSTTVSGQLYQNNFGAANPSNSTFTGTTTAGSNGTGELIFNSNSEGALYYGVDGETSLALGIDNSDVSLGVIQEQGSPTSTADVAPRHLAMIKAAARARAAKKKKQQ